MCETINAEISIGTINSLSDAVGYLKWTFYARRVRLNPSYYGASSANEEDIEDFFLSIVQDTVDKLQEHGCITVDKTEGSDYYVGGASLGRAASNFYLNYQTPKQMQSGTRSLKNILSQHASGTKSNPDASKDDFLVGNAKTSFRIQCIKKLAKSEESTYSIAKILYSLSHTHEFNELPVRHNEEELNLELSRSLPWGYDLSKVSWWMEKQKGAGKNILDIMADPHTKCFLLLQAFIFRTKLPISDYINDMRSVVEQIPRLLAALEYVAEDDKTSSGNFDMFSMFPLVRRIFNNGVMPNMPPPTTGPSIKISNVKVERQLKKGSHFHSWCMDIDFNVTMNGWKRLPSKKANKKSAGGQSVSIILGTLRGGYLLCQSSFVIPETLEKKPWKKQIKLEFEWSIAETSSGPYSDGQVVLLRVINEFVNGCDFEAAISLKE